MFCFKLLQSGNTALSLAKRLGFITIEEVLQTVTTQTTTTVSYHVINVNGARKVLKNLSYDDT